MIQFFNDKKQFLPKEINDIANQRYKEYVEKNGRREFISPNKEEHIGYGFSYHETPEGSIWFHIELGNYNTFYQFHYKNRELNFFSWKFY